MNPVKKGDLVETWFDTGCGGSAMGGPTILYGVCIAAGPKTARKAAQDAVNRYDHDMDVYQARDGFEVTYHGERPYSAPAVLKEVVYAERPGRFFLYGY